MRVEEPIMTPQPSPAHEAAGDEKLLVHNWRVARLTRLGIPDRWPTSTPTSLTRTRSPGWCTSPAPAAGPAHRPLMSGP